MNTIKAAFIFLLAFVPLGGVAWFLRVSRRDAQKAGAGGPSDPAKISQSSRLMIFFGGSAYAAEYFFDQDGLIISNSDETRRIPFRDIRSVTRTSTIVNNRSLWQIRFSDEGVLRDARFLPNLTLFNKSFVRFLATVEAANPAAEVDRLTLLRL